MTKISKEMKAKLRGKETWTATYEGHEIKVINKLKSTLYIDGVEAAKQKGIFSTNLVLTADIPNTDLTVVARVYSSGKGDSGILKCQILIGNMAETIHGFTQKDGSFDALTPEEEKLYIRIQKERNEAVTTAAIISNM